MELILPPPLSNVAWPHTPSPRHHPQSPPVSPCRTQPPGRTHARQRIPTPPPYRPAPIPGVVARLNALAPQEHVVDARVVAHTFPGAACGVPAHPDSELVHAPDVAILVQLKEREGIASNRESTKKKTGCTRREVGTQTTTGGECIDDESARTYDLLAACARTVPPRLRPPWRCREKEEGTVNEREALLARETLPVGSLRQEKNVDRKGEREQRF